MCVVHDNEEYLIIPNDNNWQDTLKRTEEVWRK